MKLNKVLLVASCMLISALARKDRSHRGLDTTISEMVEDLVTDNDEELDTLMIECPTLQCTESALVPDVCYEHDGEPQVINIHAKQCTY